MPYIRHEWRAFLDPAIKEVLVSLNRFEHSYDGAMNYVITRLLLDGFLPYSYVDYERIVGLLESIKLEFYRKAVAPYEDEKAFLNGEVY